MIGVYRDQEHALFRVVETIGKRRTYFEIAAIRSIGKNMLFTEITRDKLKERIEKQELIKLNP